MKRFNSFRLLTKTTTIYLLFIVLTFFITASFLIKKSDDYLMDQSERFFQHREHRLLEMMKDHDEDDHNEIAEEQHEIQGLIKFDNACDTLKKSYPIYNDSLIFNQDMGEYHQYKLKTVILKANNNVFEYTMHLNIDDFTKFKIGLLKTSKQAFIILALTIVLFSFFLSGWLLTPFHRILQQMNEYKIGKKIDDTSVKTNTKEFVKMQHLFKKMVLRTEDDYRKLKEYTENMAHEIQTPLAIIRNKSEILIADENVMEKHTSTVKAIYDESNHLSNLGNALNLLTKIENGEYDNIVQLKTHEIIERQIESVKELIDLKQLKIETLLSDEHTLHLDPFLFDILLKNLIRNAIRYGSDKGAIRIITTSTDFKISNYGEPLNVSPEKVFERFYTTNTSSTSLGLGLSLVKRICDLNQLRIEYSYNDFQHTFSITKV